MAKFNIKVIAKNAMDNGKPIVMATAGVIASQKFLDFKTLFPQVDPNKWFIKHEGAIKVGGVILTLAMFSKMPPLFKWILWGIAIQGAIKETRMLTMNKEGKAFFEQIGAGEYDKAIEDMANEIKKESLNGMGGEITNNSYSSVSGNPQGGRGGGAVTLMNNSATSVAGMGMDDENDRWAA